ncbi:hypothetical protein BC833DRAFT_625502 [Globomyces pollinis-pini]|nr:hypothetical protein BC833DRAFT_625502 [Globomyces pollinis-pini]
MDTIIPPVLPVRQAQNIRPGTLEADTIKNVDNLKNNWTPPQLPTRPTLDSSNNSTLNNEQLHEEVSSFSNIGQHSHSGTVLKENASNNSGSNVTSDPLTETYQIPSVTEISTIIPLEGTIGADTITRFPNFTIKDLTYTRSLLGRYRGYKKKSYIYLIQVFLSLAPNFQRINQVILYISILQLTNDTTLGLYRTSQIGGLILPMTILLLVNFGILIYDIRNSKRIMQENYVIPSLTDKLTRDYLTCTSFSHFCLFQKIEDDLPSDYKWNLYIHRYVSEWMNVVTTYVTIIMYINFNKIVNLSGDLTTYQQLVVVGFFGPFIWNILNVNLALILYPYTRWKLGKSLTAWCNEEISNYFINKNLT